jgi:hypothetical protein
VGNKHNFAEAFALLICKGFHTFQDVEIFPPDDDQGWSKHVGKKFNTASLYFILHYIMYCFHFTTINTALARWPQRTHTETYVNLYITVVRPLRFEQTLPTWYN